MCRSLCASARPWSLLHFWTMALTLLAEIFFRPVARTFPRCGVVSEALAFDIFLSFFAIFGRF